MADVPLLTRQQVAPGVQPQVNVPRRGADGLAGEVLGQAAVQIGVQARDRADRAAGLALYTEAQQARTQALYGVIEDGRIVKPGLMALRGLPLMQAHEQYEQDLRSRYDEILAGANPRVQNNLKPQLDALYASAQAQVAPHLAREVEAFQERTYNAAILSEIQSGAFAGAAVRVSPETGKIDTAQTEATKQDLLALVEGLAIDHPYLLADQTQEEWIGQEYERVTSLLHQQTVQLALANGDVDGAKRYLDEYDVEIAQEHRADLERGVGEALASYEADRAARQAVAAHPPLMSPNGAREAEENGYDYTSNAQREAMILDEAEQAGGPEARKQAKDQLKEQRDLLERQYEQEYQTIASEVLELGIDEARRRNPGIFTDYLKAKDIRALEAIDKAEREGVRQEAQEAAQFELDVMTDAEYRALTEADWVRYRAVMDSATWTKRHDAWREVKDGSGPTEKGPDIAKYIAGYAKDEDWSEAEKNNLHARAANAITLAELQSGKPMKEDEKRKVVQNMLLTELYADGAYEVEFDARLGFETGETTSNEDFDPAFVTQQREQFENLTGRPPRDDVELRDFMLLTTILTGSPVRQRTVPPTPAAIAEEQRKEQLEALRETAARRARRGNNRAATARRILRR